MRLRLFLFLYFAVSTTALHPGMSKLGKVFQNAVGWMKGINLAFLKPWKKEVDMDWGRLKDDKIVPSIIPDFIAQCQLTILWGIYDDANRFHKIPAWFGNPMLTRVLRYRPKDIHIQCTDSAKTGKEEDDFLLHALNLTIAMTQLSVDDRRKHKGEQWACWVIKVPLSYVATDSQAYEQNGPGDDRTPPIIPIPDEPMVEVLPYATFPNGNHGNQYVLTLLNGDNYALQGPSQRRYWGQGPGNGMKEWIDAQNLQVIAGKWIRAPKVFAKDKGPPVVELSTTEGITFTQTLPHSHKHHNKTFQEIHPPNYKYIIEPNPA